VCTKRKPEPGAGGSENFLEKARNFLHRKGEPTGASRGRKVGHGRPTGGQAVGGKAKTKRSESQRGSAQSTGATTVRCNKTCPLDPTDGKEPAGHQKGKRGGDVIVLVRKQTRKNPDEKKGSQRGRVFNEHDKGEKPGGEVRGGAGREPFPKTKRGNAGWGKPIEKGLGGIKG